MRRKGKSIKLEIKTESTAVFRFVEVNNKPVTSEKYKALTLERVHIDILKPYTTDNINLYGQ